MTQIDAFASALLGGLALLVGLAYLARVAFWGSARFDRVQQQGGSAFLHLELMQMGYWGMQPLAQLCTRLNLSANLISCVGCFIGVSAGFLVAQGRFGLAAAVSLAAALLDIVDGWVARATRTVSPSGKMLDSFLDRLVEFSLLAGAIFFYRQEPAFLFIALSALLGSFLVSYSTALAEIQRVEVPRGNMRRVERMTLLIVGLTLSPFSLLFEGESVAYPLAVALLTIALVGNFSAGHRMLVAILALQRGQRAITEASRRDSLSALPFGNTLEPGAGTFGPDMKPKSAAAPQRPW